ncbi:hypothetical protein [Subtercola endophyticus]|uniref:hypothetical protein n=1 Tax=Subtercola endophyticus TaxID=2895559 RepID=UPI001E4F9B49|nr:hypothetical protein [Subtercola endophyticus]UFS60184.1 hypothetical protein LQ955_05340 [Subtercola endophyticus]
MTQNEAVDSAPEARPRLSRRSVVKGAAWSAPVVGLALAAPAAAASTVLGAITFDHSPYSTDGGIVVDISGEVSAAPDGSYPSFISITAPNGITTSSTISLYPDGTFFLDDGTGTGNALSDFLALGESAVITATSPGYTMGVATVFQVNLGQVVINDFFGHVIPVGPFTLNSTPSSTNSVSTSRDPSDFPATLPVTYDPIGSVSGPSSVGVDPATGYLQTFTVQILEADQQIFVNVGVGSGWSDQAYVLNS